MRWACNVHYKRVNNNINNTKKKNAKTGNQLKCVCVYNERTRNV